MNKFYITFQATTTVNGIILGNETIKVLGEFPTTADLVRAKQDYCKVLLTRGIIVFEEQIVITFFSKIQP